MGALSNYGAKFFFLMCIFPDRRRGHHRGLHGLPARLRAGRQVAAPRGRHGRVRVLPAGRGGPGVPGGVLLQGAHHIRHQERPLLVRQVHTPGGRHGEKVGL